MFTIAEPRWCSSDTKSQSIWLLNTLGHCIDYVDVLAQVQALLSNQVELICPVRGKMIKNLHPKCLLSLSPAHYHPTSTTCHAHTKEPRLSTMPGF